MARCTATSPWMAMPAAPSCRSSTLEGDANLLVMPNIDAANISYNLLKQAAGGGIAIGPVLLGADQPGAHPHPQRHRAPHREHDRADRGRCQRGALIRLTAKPCWHNLGASLLLRAARAHFTLLLSLYL